MSRKGRISAYAWWLYSLSARTRPPRNAPSAIEMPRSELAHAVPMLARTTASGNASRRPLRATSRKSTGRTNRLTMATTPMAAAGLREHFGDDRERRAAREDRDEQQQDDDAEVLKEHDADDESSVGRVELISSVPSSLSTMAVLESATKSPAKSPRRHIDVEPENASTRRRMATAVTPIWSVPADERPCARSGGFR